MGFRWEAKYKDFTKMGYYVRKHIWMDICTLYSVIVIYYESTTRVRLVKSLFEIGLLYQSWIIIF